MLLCSPWIPDVLGSPVSTKSWEVGEDAGTGSTIPTQDRSYHRSEEGPQLRENGTWTVVSRWQKAGSDLALEMSMSLCVSVRPLPLGSSGVALWILQGVTKTHQGAM